MLRQVQRPLLTMSVRALFDMVRLEGWNLAYESSVLLSAVFARPPTPTRGRVNAPRRQEAWHQRSLVLPAGLLLR